MKKENRKQVHKCPWCGFEFNVISYLLCDCGLEYINEGNDETFECPNCEKPIAVETHCELWTDKLQKIKRMNNES